MFLESTQNQRCFNIEFYRWINVDKSTLNQRGYHAHRRRDVISTTLFHRDVISTLNQRSVFARKVSSVGDIGGNTRVVN